MNVKKALICGVSGQDGSYLSSLLLEKGYKVFGGSRDAQVNSFRNLQELNIIDQVVLVSINPGDFRSVLQVITQIEPDEIYNLSGQSSVGLSFEQPVETIESIGVATLNILEAIRFLKLNIKFYNACSSECFGDARDIHVDEETAFKPKSPYGVAKAMSFWTVANYREAYNLFACSGLLFNHESPLRPERFVTSKIISTVCRIAKGEEKKLVLGNIDISRDWGWAPEYVDAMWRMLQQSSPDDFVIATGKISSLRDFIKTAFECVGLDWSKYVESHVDLFRPTDLSTGLPNPAKAKKYLNWEAKYYMEDVVRKLIQYKMGK
jgi:GDPmannose 4,6-dehydratase